MHKYRRMGVGKQALFKVLDMHRGRWQLQRHPINTASVNFWDRVIAEYTNGKFELIKAYPDTEYPDGTLGDVFFFES